MLVRRPAVLLVPGLVVAVVVGWLVATSARPAARPEARAAPSSADLALLDRAGETLVRDCMRRKGFRYEPVPAADMDAGADFPLVVDDPAWAATHGYGSADPLAAQAAERSDPNSAYVRGLSAARRTGYTVALYGTPSDPQVVVPLPDGPGIRHSARGCQAAAETQLYGDYRRWFSATVLAGNLPSLVKSRVAARPEYLSALAEWRRCMAAGGHQATTPQQWRQQFLDAAAGRDTRAEAALARRYATAEASCARESGLGATSRRLYRDLPDDARRRLDAAVRDRSELRLAALPRARRIAGSG